MSKLSIFKRFIIFCLLIETINSAAKKKASIIKFKNVTSNFNPRYSQLLTFDITPESNENKIDVHWILSQDMTTDVFGSLSMFLKINDFYQALFSSDIDICRLWDGFNSQSIGRLWFNNIKKYGNISMTCPITKGNYVVNKMSIDAGSIPKIVTNGAYKFYLRFFTRTRNIEEQYWNATLLVEVLRT